MSEEEYDVAGPRAGTSHDGDDPPASLFKGGVNTLVQLQSQISDLSSKHDAVMSSIANLSNVQPRSIVYIPRKKLIVPFSAESGKDMHTVDEFIEEVERVMRARGLESRTK